MLQFKRNSVCRNPMELYAIVPEVIPFAPLMVAEIRFPNGMKVKEGNEIPPFFTQDKPYVSYCTQPKTYYTLFLTDPDAPSRRCPHYREWQHWVVGNIPGDKVNLGDVISEYMGSGPPPGSGLHRYVFLIYKQPRGKIPFRERHLNDHSVDYRANFSVQRFVEKYHLGDPIAGNFYQSKFDSYVPVLYKKLSG